MLPNSCISLTTKIRYPGILFKTLIASIIEPILALYVSSIMVFPVIIVIGNNLPGMGLRFISPFLISLSVAPAEIDNALAAIALSIL